MMLSLIRKLHAPSLSLGNTLTKSYFPSSSFGPCNNTLHLITRTFSDIPLSSEDKRKKIRPEDMAADQIEKEYFNEIEAVNKAFAERVQRRGSSIGVVTSDKCLKSVTVRVPYLKYFQKYNKYITRHSKIMAHDEEQVGKPGDLVRIMPCRPMSRKKRHKLVEVLRKAPQL